VANATVVLKNIFFEVNSTALNDNSTAELNQLLALLKENPTLQIQINGHTDNIGKPADNLKLSNGRAQSVVNFLVKNGIDAKRLRFQGFGATQPIADNNTEEGRARNRRTELKVIAD
jgi:outer membrane protein OmpA-like peptidoglycan-associated protein